MNTNNTELQFRPIEGLEERELLETLIVNETLAVNGWSEEIRDLEAKAKAENPHTKKTFGAHTLNLGRAEAQASKIEAAAAKDLKGYHARLNKVKRKLAENLAHLSKDLTAEGDAEQARARIDGLLQSISDEKDRADINHRFLNEVHKERNYAELSEIAKKSRDRKPETEGEVVESVPVPEPASVVAPVVQTEEPKAPIFEHFPQNGGLAVATAPATDLAEPPTKNLDEPEEKKIETVLEMGDLSKITTDLVSDLFPGETKK